jgi:gamma-glutamyltranspeptidase/glutathione hydrolase
LPLRHAVLLVAAILLATSALASGIRSSPTYRPEVVGRVGVVAAGRHFAAEAGMRMLARGGNAVDAGVAAVFAAAVTEISHFGLGGEAPLIIHLADRRETFVVNGQGTAPAATSLAALRAAKSIPASGPSAGTIPAVVDALARALSEFGTLTLAEVLEPAITLADGFPWYAFLTEYLTRELDAVRLIPSGARVYLQGPRGSIPPVGSVFRQPELAATLRALVEAERRASGSGRKDAIRAARDRIYSGDVGQRIAAAVQAAGGLLTATDLATYQGRIEPPARGTFRTSRATFEVLKTGFWGQGPVLLQTLAILEDLPLERMGHNSTEYIHTVTEALKLALADRDTFYGDPDFARIPARGLLSPAYAAARRALIDPSIASHLPRAGDPWRFEAGAHGIVPRPRPVAAPAAVGDLTASRRSPDTTTVNVVDARGNLFSASPSSAWFFGGVFIAGDTGVPLGNRMQAFVLTEDGHPNLVAPGKRPRTTLSPTVVLRNGRPWLAMSSPGGDSQDQQALQVLLNMIVFGMRSQEAIEAPRFNSLHYEESFAARRFAPGVLEVEDRIPPGVVDALRRLGHTVRVQGPFMMDTGTTLAGFDSAHGTLFGAADLRRQRFVTGF